MNELLTKISEIVWNEIPESKTFFSSREEMLSSLPESKLAELFFGLFDKLKSHKCVPCSKEHVDAKKIEEYKKALEDQKRKAEEERETRPYKMIPDVEPYPFPIPRKDYPGYPGARPFRRPEDWLGLSKETNFESRPQ